MNRACSATGWVRNPIMKSPELDPKLASSYALGWTWNPWTGCKHGCDYCYARTLAYGRLKQRYLANNNLAPLIGEGVTPYHTARMLDAINPFYPRLWPERLDQPINYKTPCGIFVVDMGELFGDWIPLDWQAQLFEVIERCPQHRFYLLTKQPQNLIKWSPFPDNAWPGVSATNKAQITIAQFHLYEVEAKVKFISFEPLLAYIPEHRLQFKGMGNHIDWVIIGAMTGKENDIKKLASQYPELTPMACDGKRTLQPPIECVEEIVRAADRAGVKVFLKDNLMPLMEASFGRENYLSPVLTPDGDLRQELPPQARGERCH